MTLSGLQFVTEADTPQRGLAIFLSGDIMLHATWRNIVLSATLLVIFASRGLAEGIAAPGAKLETLSTEFKFTEGPASDAEGNVYFTDQPNDRIMKWTIDGKLETFMQPCGRCNGLCFDCKGNLIACADERNEPWSIDVKSKEQTVLV